MPEMGQYKEETLAVAVGCSPSWSMHFRVLEKGSLKGYGGLAAGYSSLRHSIFKTRTGFWNSYWRKGRHEDAPNIHLKLRRAAGGSCQLSQSGLTSVLWQESTLLGA